MLNRGPLGRERIAANINRIYPVKHDYTTIGLWSSHNPVNPTTHELNEPDDPHELHELHELHECFLIYYFDSRRCQLMNTKDNAITVRITPSS